MVYYKYKKEKLEEKFSESKVFLVRIRECLERSPNSEDEIIDEARKEIKTLDMFLEISTEKITLVLK
ncbi:hypothetical protein FDB64_02930 [Clostridium botulinum]|nr:hypothetical protein [Clostridium botulinum]NFM02592.1 hypothetical protein [Clostridium botulinum]